MNILVVDDSEEMRSVLADALESEGYSVTTALHGKEALVKMALCKYDLVISDLLMPENDGIEFIKSLHDQHAPVIAMSGLENQPELLKLLESHGVIAFLQKPFSITRLCCIVEKINNLNIGFGITARAA